MRNSSIDTMNLENKNLVTKILKILNTEQKKKLLINTCYSILISINEAFAVGIFVGFITLSTKIDEINKLEAYEIFYKNMSLISLKKRLQRWNF